MVVQILNHQHFDWPSILVLLDERGLVFHLVDVGEPRNDAMRGLAYKSEHLYNLHHILTCVRKVHVNVR